MAIVSVGMILLVYVQPYDSRDFVLFPDQSEVLNNVLGIVGAQ